MHKKTRIRHNQLRMFTGMFLYFLLTSLLLGQEKQPETDSKIRTVVIDPGHGGKDSGALGKNSMEKDIVLEISLKAGKYIEENVPGVKVIYTRTEDVFIPLHKRAEIANENDADLFLSIHANSNHSSKPFGTSSHVLGLHRANENFEVAKRENSVILMEEDYSVRYEDFDPNSPESYIIFSLMQNVYFDQSITMGKFIQDQFRDRVNRKDRGVKQQGLLVLAQTSMPGVLVETGFISNPDEEQYLLSEQGQDYLAAAIYRAFKEYKQYIESKTVAPEVKEENADYATPVYQEPDEVKLTREDKKLSKDKYETKEGIYFKVQVIVSSNSIPLDSDVFSDFNDIEVFNTGNIYKYAVGTKTDYKEIAEYSKWVKSRFPDAFIIAVENGEIIPIKEALTKIN